MFKDKLSFLSNNVKGIKASEKRLTHCSVDVQKKWNDDYQGQLFFSHGKTNSWGITVGYYGKKSFELLSKFNNKSGRIIIIEVKIENEVLLLINLYNANTENEQLSTQSDLSNMLEKIDDINNKSIVYGRDFNLFFKAKLEALAGNPVLKKNL